jgi:hypothetical protein
VGDAPRCMRLARSGSDIAFEKKRQNGGCVWRKLQTVRLCAFCLPPMRIALPSIVYLLPLLQCQCVRSVCWGWAACGSLSYLEVTVEPPPHQPSQPSRRPSSHRRSRSIPLFFQQILALLACWPR